MAHTIQLPGNWIAIHDGSPSMDSEVTLRQIAADGMADGADHVVPYRVLYHFVAEMVRAEKIDRLERAEPDEVFYR